MRSPPFTVSQEAQSPGRPPSGHVGASATREPTYNLTVITPTASIGDRTVRVKRDSRPWAVEDLPLAYLPRNSLRTRIVATGDIAR